MNLPRLIAMIQPISVLILLTSIRLATGLDGVAAPSLRDDDEPTEFQSLCSSQLETAIDAVTRRSEFARSRWGIAIETLSTPNTLYRRDAERYFIPASNVKLLTTAAALRQLSPQFRIRTSVYGTGTIPNLASLRVVGRGDPSLTTAELTNLAQQLKRQGVRRVQQLIVDNSYFQKSGINPTWEWEDIHYAYGTSVNSLILNQNAVTLTLVPQQPGQPLQLSWNDLVAARQWRVENQSRTAAAGTKNSVEVTGVMGQRLLHIKGELAADSQPDSWNLAIPDPAHYFLESFRLILASQGITVARSEVTVSPESAHTKLNSVVVSDTGTPPNHSPHRVLPLIATWYQSMTELAVVESPPLAELVMETNQESNNLYAEALLQTLGTEVSRESTPDTGVTAVKLVLTELGVDPESYVLADGAGLSRHNLVSPDAIAQTLQLMVQTPQASVYRASLPIAGVTGTLRDRFRNTSAQGNLRAKTGTLSGASALSGYLDVPDYQPLVVSIIVNQSDQSTATLRQAIDEIILLLTRLRSC
ncbi:MAG: D-alanyl-D-alanine carboxypeptidase/D-alanyl-D-alanine-endopeptidase [Coleofasciculus sp. S288]|nr:D-alanyl-D-alanine carboxypeptidase/D-alanyl-D-alanine-endopeptidase [Coleofasciculus sp. S288]